MPVRRRAYDRNGRQIRPGTIGTMRERDGFRHVAAYCSEIGCGHEGLVDVEGWRGEIFVPDAGLYLVCTGCGAIGTAETRPDWREWRAAGMPRRLG